MKEQPTLELALEEIVEGTDDLPEIERERGSRIVAPAANDTSDRPAPYIGEYRLLARFPSSPAGDVFLAVRRKEFGYARRAVIKVVWSRRSGYEERRRVLLDEARAIAALDHPNIVKMLDCGGGDFGAYLALEFVDGVDLQRVIVGLRRRKQRLPIPMTLFIVSQVLRGLDHAHGARDASDTPLNLVHRDANPSNILVARTGHSVLADFGIVRMRDRYQTDTAPDLVKGKFRYLAPEYIMSREMDHRIDLYSLGIVLFECLTGGPWTTPRTPNAMKKIVTEGVPLPLLETAGVPAPLRALVTKAVARDPDARYQTAAAMADAVEEYLNHEGVFVGPAQVGAFLSSHGVFDGLKTDVVAPRCTVDVEPVAG